MMSGGAEKGDGGGFDSKVSWKLGFILQQA
jgi:hypothetical protein